MLESIEHRRLLSAVIVDRVLNVGGTNGDDQIVLYEGFGSRISVKINDDEFGFQRWELDRVVINANAGHDRVVLGPDPDMGITLYVPYDIPTLVLGGRGQDSIYGGEANDTLDGGTGVNEVYGRGGDDLLRAANTDADTFSGGEGTDTVDYTGRTDNLSITLDDVATDGRMPPEISVDPSTLVAELDNVRADIENVIGGGGDDQITGNAANNILSGGGGDDMLFGGHGRDVLNGNWGNDRLIGGRGADLLIGGGSNDTADYSDHKDDALGVYVTLDGVANDGTLGATTSGRPAAIEFDNVKGDVENVIGTAFNDFIVGNDASNTLDGRDGDDFLDGGDGRDLLRGGNGNDQLRGGDGDGPNNQFATSDGVIDTLRGGDGDDVAEGDDDDLLIGTDRGDVFIVV
jgi:Ca2+-binding RTX toxin-like protein